MNNVQNIIIIGMPGSGKTTIGKALAARLGRDFYDADDVVVEQEGKSIKDLFAISEDCFRNAEIRASETLAAKEGIVVACGGGVIKRTENMEILKKTGTVIFLDRTPDEIVSDVDVSMRPLLKDGKQKVYDLYDERIQAYRAAADYTVANHTAMDEVVDSMVHLVEKL
ncbi:MAG: shikimate kinase [Megasphaera sp.]|jgi:shikimate kinase|nr:shikimate kinase [Megasphaera sp.]MCH4188469.1 shikimate kinase [Megasphaera sp.]MCH4218229.1 shikimate kinase [Megasphaera sp.]